MEYLLADGIASHFQFIKNSRFIFIFHKILSSNSNLQNDFFFLRPKRDGQIHLNGVSFPISRIRPGPERRGIHCPPPENLKIQPLVGAGHSPAMPGPLFLLVGLAGPRLAATVVQRRGAPQPLPCVQQKLLGPCSKGGRGEGGRDRELIFMKKSMRFFKKVSILTLKSGVEALKGPLMALNRP